MNKYKSLLFLAALSQIVFTFFTNFSGGSNFNQLLITPAGYTFSIWGLIIVFTTIFSFYHLFFDKHIFSKSFYLYSILVYISYTLWLLAAENDLLWLTILIFLAMFYSLLKIYKEASNQFNKNIWNKIFFQIGISAYIAWASVAFIINIFVYLFSFNISVISFWGIFLQVIALIFISINVAFVLKITEFNKYVFVTHLWAFLGLIIGLSSRENTNILLIFSILSLSSLTFYFINKGKVKAL